TRGTGSNENGPSVVDVAVREKLVAAFVRSTVAPATMLPCGSFTRPRTVEVPAWLKDVTADRKMTRVPNIKAKLFVRDDFVFMVPPLDMAFGLAGGCSL